jgi:hypothetical protein
MVKTKAAFDAFKGTCDGPKQLPQALVRNADEVRQMTEQDGMSHWKDGPVDGTVPLAAHDTPDLTEEMVQEKHLWVVGEDGVPFAEERGAFGRSLASGVIKHSNLTGGGTAYSGGELVVLDKDKIIVNGYSGRYGPRTEAEMTAAAKAFRLSGYFVWSMGFDVEANKPFDFIHSLPRWVP